jgi:MarR family transcriptional regulator, lower aerobic nicotinate degradation pathway regulator
MSTPTSSAPLLPSAAPRELLLSSAFLLKRLGWLINERAHDALAPKGLTPQHHGVLSLLDEGTRETQGEIADTLGYDRSHLVGLLDELEEKGLVTRQRDPGDRRRQIVSLTPAGKDMLGELRALAKQLEKEFLAPLAAAERRTLHELLLVLAGYHDPRCRRSG